MKWVSRVVIEKVANRNIVILPPEEVIEEAIRLSRNIGKKHQTNFVLNRKNRWPHITLHQFAIPEEISGRWKL